MRSCVKNEQQAVQWTDLIKSQKGVEQVGRIF